MAIIYPVYSHENHVAYNYDGNHSYVLINDTKWVQNYNVHGYWPLFESGGCYNINAGCNFKSNNPVSQLVSQLTSIVIYEP